MCYSGKCPHENKSGDCRLTSEQMKYIPCYDDEREEDEEDNYEPDYDQMLEYKREARERRR